MAEKARYWTGVLYPENMRADWQEVIGDVIGFPYAYCIHDKDMLGTYQLKEGEEHQRKTHVHLLIAYSNTTTYNSVFKLMSKLSAPGVKCINKVESVGNVRNMYEYLIHNTETSKKQGKFLYPAAERITGNNFDIGAFEQVSMADKNRMARELCDSIIEHGFTNFADFYMYVVSCCDDEYFDILKTYSGLFERLTKANYQKSAEV